MCWVSEASSIRALRASGFFFLMRPRLSVHLLTQSSGVSEPRRAYSISSAGSDPRAAEIAILGGRCLLGRGRERGHRLVSRAVELLAQQHSVPDLHEHGELEHDLRAAALSARHAT